MTVIPQVERPRVETEIKIGNTYYRVNGFFASQGITVSKKIMRYLTRKQRSKKVAKIRKNLTFYLTFSII